MCACYCVWLVPVLQYICIFFKFILPAAIVLSDITHPFDFPFYHQENAQNITVGPLEKKEVKCAFWNFTGGRNGFGAWSFDGINTVFENGTHVRCASKHVTSFVVLVSIVPIDEVNLLPVHMQYTYMICTNHV